MNGPLAPPDLLGRELNNTYRIIARLAEGGMASIFEAEHVRLANKRYAVKVLHANLSADHEALVRFRREAQIAASLHHQHIVEVLDYYQTHDGLPYIVMELLDGETLQARIDRAGPLPGAAAAMIMEQVASGVSAAHEAGIVHRDLKPENIFLVDQGSGGFVVKVLDFGISKMRFSTSVVTMQNSLLGTSFYMSPEQARSAHHEVDHTTDVFAMGAITYQSLCGVRPFEAPTLPAVVYKVLHDEPPPLTTLAPHLPREIDAVLARAMHKDKRRRHPSALEFVDALRAAVLGGMSTPGPAGGPAGGRGTLPDGSGRWREPGASS